MSDALQNTFLSFQLELLKREMARRSLLDYVQYVMPAYQCTLIHKEYIDLIDLFVKGIIRKLIVTMPPQHGKSEVCSIKLPAFLFGHNPDAKITVASYNATFVRKFSTAIQREISSQEYHNLFPKTTISKTKFTLESDVSHLKTKEEFEIVNRRGSLKAIGRGGALTGNPVDYAILDDIYKDYAEANSPVIREAVIDWYSSVVKTRLHNKSQQLLTFTRWHEDDLIGFIEKSDSEEVIVLTNRSQLDSIDSDKWYKINFPALSTRESIENEFDHRKVVDRPLWFQRHSKKKLIGDRSFDEEKFESLYQGNPKPKRGLLYSGFNIYTSLPDFKLRRNYTDVADRGNNYLCSINYFVGVDDYIYVIDVFYTQEGAAITEPGVASMLIKNRIKESFIESNSGGAAFARNIDRLCNYKVMITPFHQGGNKESRIITNAAEVQRRILMPSNWTGKWPLFAEDLLRFKKLFKANRFDDAPDALTGCLEYSGISDNINYSLYQV